MNISDLGFKLNLTNNTSLEENAIQSELNRGINISLEIKEKIQDLIAKITSIAGSKEFDRCEEEIKLKTSKNDEVQWLHIHSNLIFRFSSEPHLVFKLPAEDSQDKTDSRYENMIKGREVCLTHQLGLLIIPHAQKFEVTVDGKEYSLIAEEYLPLEGENRDDDDLIDYHVYEKYSDDVTEAICQLAVFIAKTGFNDVMPRNIPLLKEEQGFKGSRRICLIDLEHMESANGGFKADFDTGAFGLFSCFSNNVHDKVNDKVLEIANQHGMNYTQADIKDAFSRAMWV